MKMNNINIYQLIFDLDNNKDGFYHDRRWDNFKKGIWAPND